MSPRVRIAEKFKTLSTEQLVAMAGAIINGLTGNPAFPDLPVDLKTVQTAIDDVIAALAVQPHEGVTAMAEKKNKQEALIALLRRLKHYVEDNCGNDLAAVLSSGFQAAAGTRTRAPLAIPSILKVAFGNSRELVLRVPHVTRARCYEVRAAAMSAGSIPGDWQPAGLFTNSRSMTVAGLIPGTMYLFQVRAIGGSTGHSDWSTGASRMCV